MYRTDLVFVPAALQHTLRQPEGNERVSAQSHDVSSANCHHLGDEAVHESVQTSTLQEPISLLFDSHFSLTLFFVDSVTGKFRL